MVRCFNSVLTLKCTVGLVFIVNKALQDLCTYVSTKTELEVSQSCLIHRWSHLNHQNRWLKNSHSLFILELGQHQ